LEKFFENCPEIVVVPVSYYKKMELPNCDNWLEQFWCKSLELMSEDAQEKNGGKQQNKILN